MKNKAAQELGRLGGKATTEAKATAARANGAKGGRPRLNTSMYGAHTVPSAPAMCSHRNTADDMLDECGLTLGTATRSQVRKTYLANSHLARKLVFAKLIEIGANPKS